MDILVIVFVIVSALAILAITGMWKTFEKAGEPGWKVLIPVYNLYIIIRIAGHSGWWLLAFFLPLLSIAVIIMVMSGATEQLAGGFGSLAGDPSINSISNSITFAAQLLAVSMQVMILVGSVITYNFCRSFGKGLPFTLGLSLLAFVFWPILGFGRAVYHGPVAAEDEMYATSQDAPVSSRDQEEPVDVDPNNPA